MPIPWSCHGEMDPAFAGEVFNTACRLQPACACYYGSPDISGHECVSIEGPGSIAGSSYKAGEAAAQATAQSERTRPWLFANRFQAISQASMMSARLENTELASQ